MRTVSFIADTPAAALVQIQAELGPEAVVLSVRPVPAQGMARLLPGRRRVEVLAGVPEPELSVADRLPVAAATLPQSAFSQTGEPVTPNPLWRETACAPSVSHPNASRWPSIAWLEAMGLLPTFADRLQTLVLVRNGGPPPDSLEAEWSAVTAVLASVWRNPPPLEETSRPARPHVFVGPPGSGKTTALCKWLTQAVLTQDRTARVWRLDAGAANTSEYLSLHCEMLGVPVERFWSEPDLRAELLFVDLPGADPHDEAGMTALRSQVASLPSPHIHLVLNAAYESNMLVEQWQAFEPLRPADVILTHVDEERRRVKLWNLIFGTNCIVRFLSGGQKIPGEFRAASPEQFFPSGIPR